MSHILEIKDLQVQYHTEDGTVYALNHVDLELDDGETLGLVGETGAGKTTLAKSIMRLIPDPPGKIEGGVIEFEGRDLLKASGAEIRAVRGNQISMIFQDPMTSLNPLYTIQRQMEEVLILHEPQMNAAQRRARCLELLSSVGIPNPEERLKEYPNQFSGGMRQRVIIAIALANNPKLIIADECISALDVSIQAQVVNLMKDIQQETGTAYLFIAHDLSMVKYISDRIGVLHLGHLLETGTTEEIFENPIHPYTRSLLSAIPLPNPVVEKRRVAETYDYATSGIDYTQGTNHHVSGSHYVKCTDDEFRKWTK